MSTIKVDTLDTRTGTGNITLNRPLVGDGSGLTSLSAANLTGTLPAISGASLTNLPASPRPNLTINGGMTVAQRGTSETGVSTSGFRNAPDRFKLMEDNGGTWTVSQSTDSPDGFGNSYKFDCTTAQASLAVDAYLWLEQYIEAQDLQHLNWGSSSAESITLSFWVKTNKTGTYIIELTHGEVPGDYRYASLQYTVSASNTWEKKTLTFTGNTNHTINNDTGRGLGIAWYLAVGTDQTSGSYTAGTFRNGNTSANRCVGHNVNLADSTSNEWFLTGVKLEVGSSATDYEHKSYGEELALCKRYYQKSIRPGTTSYPSSGGYARSHYLFPVEMRASPTGVFTDLGSGGGSIATGIEADGFYNTYDSLAASEAGTFSWTMNAEL